MEYINEIVIGVLGTVWGYFLKSYFSVRDYVSLKREEHFVSILEAVHEIERNCEESWKTVIRNGWIDFWDSGDFTYNDLSKDHPINKDFNKIKLLTEAYFPKADDNLSLFCKNVINLVESPDSNKAWENFSTSRENFVNSLRKLK